MPDDSKPEELIDSYLAGELPPELVAQVRAYVEAHPGRRGVMAGVHAAFRGEPFLAASAQGTDGLRRRVWRQLEQELDDRTRRDARQETSSRGARSFTRMFAGLGVASVALLGIILVHRTAQTPQTSPNDVRTYRTVATQRARVTLSDGSHVTLAPSTTLRVTSQFGRSTRTVELNGEAYFDVTATTHAPFIVESGTIRTQVLGTTFVVRHYTNDPTTHVAVVAGKVAVARGTTAGIPVTAGMVAVATDSSVVTTTPGDVTSYTAWRNGTLIFRYTPIPDVLATFERWYGVEFRVADSTLTRGHLTASFEDAPRDAALATLAQLLNCSISADGHVITLQVKQNARGMTRRAVHDSFTTSTPVREVGR